MAILILNPKTAEVQIIPLDQPSMLFGSAQDADIRLDDDSLPGHCARIEAKPDGYYIINLCGSGEVLVNGDDISFQRVNHGDKIEFGNIPAEIQLTAKEAPDRKESPDDEKPATEFMPVAFSGANGLAVRPQGPSVCPQCGFPLSPGMVNCPQCGLSLSNLPAMPMGYIPPVAPGQIGPGILPIIAFLAALTVVGAPIALVLGLMSLSIIRRRGGTVRDRALAKWSVGLGLIWLMVGAGVAAGAIHQAHKRKQLSAADINETKVIRALKNLACAERYARTVEAFDVDSDGQGEYGTLDALPSIKSPFFDAELTDGDAYGYRFTIREASEGRFLAVAEPVHYGASGIRTFVIDQTGQVRGGDTEGKPFGQIAEGLPVLQGERNAYYEIDDQIAKDVLNYVKSLSISLPDQEKKQRILRRLRENYALTSVGLGLEGMEKSVDRFVSEEHAQAMFQEANTAYTEGKLDVALSKFTEIQKEHPAFSKIAAAERTLSELRSMIAQKREQEAQALFAEAEKLERQGGKAKEVQKLYQQITSRYPDTALAERVSSLTPELQRQMRERGAENLFSELMELSPEYDYEEILSRADQLRRNYNDTDLLKTVETSLTDKERKARASSWRAKTKENIEEGRMRGALAQLEAAARENPDLLYDLRDLFVTLYRSVADTLVKEGDMRKALTYYERLNQLVRADDPEGKASPDLLAQLHKDVGLADFEQGDYKAAKWHLTSAEWKYKDNAAFNTKLAAANLRLGLYVPAKTALDQALAVETNMPSALLYKSYLHLREALMMEEILVKSFQKTEDKEDEKDETDSKDSKKSASGKSDESEEKTNVTIDMSNYDGDISDLEEAIRNTRPTEKVEVEGPQSLNLQSSNNVDDWFSNYQTNQLNASVPGPKDLNFMLNFNYETSSGLLTSFMTFIDRVRQQKQKELVARREVSSEADSGVSRARASKQAAEKARFEASRQEARMQFNSLLRDLRKTHVEDIGSRNELYGMIGDMKQRLRSAAKDLQAASLQQPQIQSLTKNLLSQINTKYELLEKTDKLLVSAMKQEIDIREDIMDLAGETLEKDTLSQAEEDRFDRTLSRLKKKLFDKENLANIDEALRALRESMNVHVELESLLRAAEKNT